MAVVVERPLAAEMVDRGELGDRCIGALEVVTPVPFPGRDLVMRSRSSVICGPVSAPSVTTIQSQSLCWSPAPSANDPWT
jgi:hypothetical protein